MQLSDFRKTAAFVLFSFILTLAGSSLTKAQTTQHKLNGDWRITIDYEGRQIDAILSFSKDANGTLTGRWISPWGVSDLQNVKYEGNTLTFKRVRRWRQNESTSTFTGTIKGSTLSGTLWNDTRTSAVEGELIKPMPAAVGQWEMKTTRNGREIIAVLSIKSKTDGTLTGQWRTEYGESSISDIRFEDDRLTFTRTRTRDGQQRESKYNLTVKGDTLSGTVESRRGEAKVEGRLAGTPLIGKWQLNISSERGDRSQILWVCRDMSGMYGSLPIDKINLEGQQVSFTLEMSFRQRTWNIRFQGALEGEKLTGEITGFGESSRKVTGRKLNTSADS
jgi:hypothetical protein